MITQSFIWTMTILGGSCTLAWAYFVALPWCARQVRRRAAGRAQLLAEIDRRGRALERAECDKAQLAGFLEGQEEVNRLQANLIAERDSTIAKQSGLIGALASNNARLRDELASACRDRVSDVDREAWRLLDGGEQS